MKIVHFHPNPRMAKKFIFPLMKSEYEAGHQSELICSFVVSGIKNTYIPFALSLSNLPRLPLALWRIWKYLKGICPDVVFIHNTTSSILPLLGAWLASVNVRVYFNHGVPYVGHKGITRLLLYTLERWNTALATNVVTVSTDMLKLLKEINPQINVQMIRNGSACGLDLNQYTENYFSKIEWRQAHGLQIDDLLVVYIGRPVKRKGFELVLKLWAEYLNNKKNIKLLLCGCELDHVLNKLGYLPSNIIPLGYVDKIEEVLLASDLLILPSLHEGLSYACMESQAAGTVIIANDISGIRCLVENGKSGFLVPQNDLLKYFEIIQGIYDNRASIDSIRRQAKKDIQIYSRPLFMNSYISFLEGLIQNKDDHTSL